MLRNAEFIRTQGLVIAPGPVTSKGLFIGTFWPNNEYGRHVIGLSDNETPVYSP